MTSSNWLIVVSVEFGVSNSVANYMTMIFFSTGRYKMKYILELSENNESTNAQIDQLAKTYQEADEELKGILKSNDMELEDLFLALAIECNIPCQLGSNPYPDCCELVWIVFLSYKIVYYKALYYIMSFSFMKSQPSQVLEHATPPTNRFS